MIAVRPPGDLDTLLMNSVETELSLSLYKELMKNYGQKSEAFLTGLPAGLRGIWVYSTS